MKQNKERGHDDGFKAGRSMNAIATAIDAIEDILGRNFDSLDASAIEDALEILYAAGFDIGLAEGQEVSRLEGYSEGYSEGFSDGQEEM